MKPPPFAYELAPDLQAALASLSTHAGDGKILAGGQSLIPLLNFRIVRPAVLIDINCVTELDHIILDGDVLRLPSFPYRRNSAKTR
jgi:carbon-monoxide dehydrogenase medium subunit